MNYIIVQKKAATTNLLVNYLQFTQNRAYCSSEVNRLNYI